MSQKNTEFFCLNFSDNFHVKNLNNTVNHSLSMATNLKECVHYHYTPKTSSDFG